MNHCHYCGTTNRAGVLFCEECGRNLHSQTNELSTIVTSDDDTRERLKARVREINTQRQHHPGSINSVLIYIRDAASPLMIRPEHRATLGRHVDAEPLQPDFDLTPYGALEKGVSRIHAAIQCMRDGVTLMDMNSTNGSSINGEMLQPQIEHHLSDGDEIHIGSLVAHVYFE